MKNVKRLESNHQNIFQVQVFDGGGNVYRVYTKEESETVYCPDLDSYRIDNMLREKYSDWDK